MENGKSEECNVEIISTNIKVNGESDKVFKATELNAAKICCERKETAKLNGLRSSKYRYVILISSTLIQGLSACLFSCYGILLMAIVEATGQSNALVSWFGGLWSLLLGFSSLFIGPLAVYYGSRKVVMFGSLVSAAGFVMSAFAPNMLIVVIGMGAFQGIGTSCYQIAPFLITSKWFVERRGGALSFLSFGVGIGMLLWSPLIALLIEAYTWRGALLLMGAIYLNGLVLGLLLIEPTNDKETAPLSLIKAIGRNLDKKLVRTKNFFIYLSGTSLLYFGHMMVLAYLPRKIVEIGRSRVEGSLMVTVTSAVSCLIRLVIGAIAHKKYFKQGIIYSLSSIMAGIGSFLTLSSDSLGFYYAYSAIFGLTSGCYVALTVPTAVEVFEVKYLANITAWSLLLAGVFMMGSTTIGGWLYDLTGNATYNFLLGGVAMFIAGLFIVLLMSNLKKKKKERRASITLTTK
ncbi:unnamed protein product [Dimorphilus gyrociliatus]|uniref:Major facilitator superfamily (MFS) profile domain-containing protein n=1 Tax=Dimorphilus gyrociliatus TaxID=2664684 RepID=A0A7I8V9P0_9ANNE|nr:unnamed protein product [Dimorphilus gyrociliatus]